MKKLAEVTEVDRRCGHACPNPDCKERWNSLHAAVKNQSCLVCGAEWTIKKEADK